MSREGSRKTILDLSITIPNTKSSSSLKLSNYMNIDERLFKILRCKPKCFPRMNVYGI